MKQIRSVLVATAIAVAVLGSAIGVAAHEMTYKGTVVAAEAKTLQVKVMDDATSKESTITFEITAKTKIFRGDKAVKYGDAQIQKDERIAVTVDHDQPGHAALEVRLAAASK